MIRTRQHFSVLILLSAFSLSCKDDTTAPADDARMHIDVQTSLTLVAGTTEAVNVTVVRNDYTGVVTLRAENLPGGVTVPDITVASGESSVNLLFSATGSVSAGGTDVTIRADADSVAPSLRTLRLNLKPPGSFTLGAEPVPVTPANSASTVINVNRLGGFDGPVTLSVSAPTGLTASLNPSELSGVASTSLLTVLADRTARPGAYFVTVRASSPGFADEILEVTVTVNGS